MLAIARLVVVLCAIARTRIAPLSILPHLAGRLVLVSIIPVTTMNIVLPSSPRENRR